VKPRFFATQAKWRAWLEKNHASAAELWVGFHKVHTGKPSINWPQSVDEALCFGWIDGLRRGLGEDAYMIRFTPRRPGSAWSKVNLDRVAELTRLGLMREAGLAAHARRDAQRAGYTYASHDTPFDDAAEKTFRRERAAWKFFSAQPPGYRRIVTHWVMSAKREETRAKRLAELIADSARGERLGRVTKYTKR
jgi:uncharacterized protein YdeI (YjbR/CyaY-like superfamily)